MNKLKDETKAGFYWSLANGVGTKGVSFVVMIILARILTPEDFGMIAMVTIFIQISQAFVVSGFSQALIQKDSVDKIDYSSVFYLNVALGLFFYFVLFVSSPFIAEFYSEPRLVLLIRLLSFLFVINSFGIVQETIFTRALDFKRIALINLPAVFISGMVSIVMAYSDFGVWSIVAFQVVNRFIYVMGIWLNSEWRPIKIFSYNRVKEMWGFSSFLLLAGLVVTLYNNIYHVFFGKFYPVSDVGNYHNSYTITQTPIYTITGAFGNVILSSLSRIKENNKSIADIYSSIIHWLCLLVFPTYFFMYTMAYYIIEFVFTEKWIASVPYFKLLCIVACFVPLMRINLLLFNVKGFTNIYFFIVSFNVILSMLSIFIFRSEGIEFLLFINVLIIIFIYILAAVIVQLKFEYKVFDQVINFLPVLLISISSSIILKYLLPFIELGNSFYTLILGFFIFLMLYTIGVRLVIATTYFTVFNKVKKIIG